MGTLTDATEGMLQDGGDGSGCVKVVVRENETTTVVAAPSTDTVVRAPNAAVVARSQTNAVVAVRAPSVERIVAQQTETIVASRGCDSGAGPGGVSSYLDLTDVPTEFTPAPHIHALLDVTGIQAALDAKAAVSHSHAVSDVTGLEPRLFATGTSFVYDIDITNADEGITDPYKFKTVYAAALDILALIPQLPLNGDNTITMLLGDGEHLSTGFTYLFSFGAAGGFDFSYLGAIGLAGLANARFHVTSKSTPANITNAEWSLVTSTATYGAQRAATFAANKALVQSRFPCRIVTSAAEPWQSAYIMFPVNFKLSGVAIVAHAENVAQVYVGCLGTKAVAVVGCTYSGGRESGAVSLYNELAYNDENARIYIVNGTASMHAITPAGTEMSMVMVNLTTAVWHIQPVEQHYSQIYVWSVFYCLGAIQYPEYGWVSVEPVAGVSLFIRAGSVLKSGEIFLSFFRSYLVDTPLTLYIDTGSLGGSGAKLYNATNAPIIAYNYSVLSTKHPGSTGGFVSRVITPPKALYGTGSPNSTMLGRPGDTYQNLSGGAAATLWVKESGIDTNTGWVAK